MDWDTVSGELSKKLDAAHIKKPSGKFGPKGDYLEGWHVINEANRIFGFDGWSYTINLTRDALQDVAKDGKTQWQAAYTCICTLRVGSVERQDVGFGSGYASQIGDAIEGATKEAVTDSLKRALRTFGNQFGLALYDKSRENVEPLAPTPKPAETRDPRKIADNMILAVKNADTDGKLYNVTSNATFIADGKWLADAFPPMAGEVRKAIGDAKLRVTPKDEPSADLDDDHIPGDEQ